MSQQILATHEWPASGTDTGARAPVAVLVHGIAGWWRTWWRVGPALAERGWRAIAVDQRGHGNSPRIEGVANVTSWAADLSTTVDALGIGPLDLLLGHSLGAFVSMELVRSRPAIARRVVLEDPPGQIRADDFAWQATFEREVLTARADPEAEVRRELAENPTWLTDDARFDVEGRALCDVDRILASLRMSTDGTAVELAPLLDVPALYLLADEARSVLGSRRSQLIRSLPPTAEVVEFDAGHVIHRDRFDEYMATVLGWLGAPDGQ